jgi:hypothetical protein
MQVSLHSIKIIDETVKVVIKVPKSGLSLLVSGEQTRNWTLTAPSVLGNLADVIWPRSRNFIFDHELLPLTKRPTLASL